MDGNPPQLQDNFQWGMYPLNQDTAGAGASLDSFSWGSLGYGKVSLSTAGVELGGLYGPSNPKHSNSVIPTPSTESWAAPTHEGTAPVPQVPQGVTPQHPAWCFPFPVSANPAELFPTSPCLLLAPPWGLWGSPDFSGEGFGTSSGFSACLGEACSFKAALQEFSSAERDPDGMAQVSEGMSSLHSSI